MIPYKRAWNLHEKFPCGEDCQRTINMCDVQFARLRPNSGSYPYSTTITLENGIVPLSLSILEFTAVLDNDSFGGLTALTANLLNFVDHVQASRDLSKDDMSTIQPRGVNLNSSENNNSSSSSSSSNDDSVRRVRPSMQCQT